MGCDGVTMYAGGGRLPYLFTPLPYPSPTKIVDFFHSFTFSLHSLRPPSSPTHISSPPHPFAFPSLSLSSQIGPFLLFTAGHSLSFL